MDAIPETGTAKDIRNLVKSVFIPALPQDSRARQIAEQADDPTDLDSYLRGKDEFARAGAALLQLPDSSADGKIRFRLASQGDLTAAGMVVALWQKASADRTTIFSGMGALGPTIMVCHVDGVDLNTLWSDDASGEPQLAKGNPGASVQVFETAPSLNLPKQPDPNNGVIIAEEGAQVSVKRRGNTSRRDPKINISVYLDKDDESGIPRELNLLNAMRDPSYQRVRLAFDIFGMAKCPVRPTIYAELTLNGNYFGTYVALPPMDEYHFNEYLPNIQHRAIFKGNYGDIPGGAPLALRGSQGSDYFTPNSRPDQRTYEPRIGTPDSDYVALARFITTFYSQEPASAAFVDTVRKILDVESFLRSMVVVNLLGSWDTYYLNSQNYFLHLAVDDSPANNPPFGTMFFYDVDSLLGVSWPGQKRNWQDKDLLFRGKEIGKIPLITRLLANPTFQNYYLDFMEWFVKEHFNVAGLTGIQSDRWSILEKSVYLESDTPYGYPHTGRSWTNDQVYRASVLGQTLTADQGPVAGIEVDGITPFVDARCKKVLGQLAGMTRTSSGVDFDSDNWSLPA